MSVGNSSIVLCLAVLLDVINCCHVPPVSLHRHSPLLESADRRLNNCGGDEVTSVGMFTGVARFRATLTRSSL